MFAVRLILSGIIAYLLGNIQTGLLIARMSGNIDLRSLGSGSSGATNVLRVLGSQSALFTLLGDFLKGLLAVGIGLIITGYYGGMAAAVFVVVGHIWPVFFGFHGGKGVATSIGALLLVLPWHTLLMVAVGVAVLIFTKTVSLASITGALVLLISGIISAILRHDGYIALFTVFMAALVIFAHRSNIVRLRRGNENKITSDMFHKK